MTDTVKIDVPIGVWTDITASSPTGLITNNSEHSIRYRESAVQPSVLDTFGHILHPQDETYFDLIGIQKIWGLGFYDDAKVAITPGQSLSKNGFFLKDFFLEITKGNIPGHISINKFGHNPSVASGTEEDVWAAGNTLAYLTAADTLDIVSTDAGDNQAGDGARSIFIQGLDGNFDEISETINTHATDGMIAVTTVNSYIRVWRGNVVGIGLYGGTNLGDITFSDTIGGSTQAFIQAGEGQTDGTHYTIPANKTGYLIRPGFITDASKSVDIHLIARENADVVVAPFSPSRHRQHWKGLDSPYQENYKAFKMLPEKTDIKYNCDNNGGAASAISVNYDLLLVDNL